MARAVRMTACWRPRCGRENDCFFTIEVQNQEMLLKSLQKFKARFTAEHCSGIIAGTGLGIFIAQAILLQKQLPLLSIFALFWIAAGSTWSNILAQNRLEADRLKREGEVHSGPPPAKNSPSL